MNGENGSEPVTRSILAAELAASEQRMQARIDAAVTAAVSASEERMLERIEKVETTLLKEFRKWAVRFETPFRANEVLISGFNERLSSVEDRMDDLEHK